MSLAGENRSIFNAIWHRYPDLKRGEVNPLKMSDTSRAIQIIQYDAYLRCSEYYWMKRGMKWDKQLQQHVKR